MIRGRSEFIGPRRLAHFHWLARKRGRSQRLSIKQTELCLNDEAQALYRTAAGLAMRPTKKAPLPRSSIPRAHAHLRWPLEGHRPLAIGTPLACKPNSRTRNRTVWELKTKPKLLYRHTRVETQPWLWMLLGWLVHVKEALFLNHTQSDGQPAHLALAATCAALETGWITSSTERSPGGVSSQPSGSSSPPGADGDSRASCTPDAATQWTTG